MLEYDDLEKVSYPYCKECGAKNMSTNNVTLWQKNCSHNHERFKSYGDKYCRHCGTKLTGELK